MRYLPTVLLWVPIVLLAVVCPVTALNICNKCGYENAENACKCSHCGAVLKENKGAADIQASTVPEETRQGDFIFPAGVVAEEISKGRELYQKQKYELSRLFFRNALAMEGIADADDGAERSAKILAMVKQSETAARVITKKCPRCDGTGRGIVKFETLGSSGQSGRHKPLGGWRRKVPGKTCQRCNGTGTIKTTGTVADMKYKTGQALSDYREMQRSRKYVPVGNAWVPADIEPDLGVRQKAMLMRATASPCEECAGFGKVDCRKCDGEGRIKCTNKDCHKGRVPLEEDDKKVKRLQSDNKKICPVCHGRGTLRCEECDGEGAVLCPRCDGTGEQDICRKCSGQGYVECRRCKGTGRYKDGVCASCGGEGVELCSSCGGDGRKD